MDLISRASITQASIPASAAAATPLTRNRINRLWAELPHSFRQLEVAPDDSFARFYAGSQETGLTIQPPHLHLTRLPEDGGLELETEALADDAQGLFAGLAGLLELDVLVDVRIRQVYNVPVADEPGAARDLIEAHMFGLTEHDLSELQSGEDGTQWSAARFVVPRGTDTYTLNIEPMLFDEMRSIYIDLDAQFPGPSAPDSFDERIRDARHYIEGPVTSYLERLTARGN